MQSVECVSLIEGPSHIYTKISEDKQKPVPQGNMPVLTLEIGELYIYIISHWVAMVIQFIVHIE